VRSSSDRWWLLPLGILVGSALVALGIVVLGPYFLAGSPIEADQSASSEPVHTDEAGPVETSEEAGETAETSKATNTHEVHCTDPSRNDYACIQKRYQDLVHASGVEAAFAQLRSEMASNEFVRTNCHQMTHVIGRAAAEVYGDIPGTYSQVDTALASFCGSGYYHGAMETIVAELGRDKILEEANTLCADLGGQPKYSFFRYNCAHGLGHGFMGVQENELFESLESCDTLTDDWERNRCYGGVFMENVITRNNPGHPSKYLKADEPLYPCDIVEDRHKDDCYQRQSSYALETRGNDFAEVFDLCAAVEDGFRPSCYQGLGWDASVQSLKQGAGDAEVNGSTGSLCMLGEDQEARSNCVFGAVDYFIRDRYDTAKARSFCESLGADLRAPCLQEVEEYYATLQSPLERRRT
jgi:hypothetical protein